MEQPTAQPGQIEGVPFSSQTRRLNKKSLSSSEPTGQISTTFPCKGLSSGRPGNTSISVREPRLTIHNSCVPDISSVSRTQRVHITHRSWYSSVLGPMFFLGLTSFWSTIRDAGLPNLKL